MLTARTAIAAQRGVEHSARNDEPQQRGAERDRWELPVVYRFCDDRSRYGHDQQDRDDKGEGGLQNLAGLKAIRINSIINAARITGEDSDVEPEVVQPLVAAHPDAHARQGNHQTVEERDTNDEKYQIGDDLEKRKGFANLIQGIAQQREGEHDLIHHRQLHLLARDQELRVDRFEQDEIQIASAYQLAEVGAVRHEKRLDDRVNQHAGRHEGKILRFRPAADEVDVAVNDFEKRDLSGKPERPRDQVDQKVAAKRHLADESVAEKRRPDAMVGGSGFGHF